MGRWQLTAQTLLAGAILVLAALCYDAIRDVRLQLGVEMEGTYSITTINTKGEPITTTRTYIEGWMAAHRAAVEESEQ